MGLLPSQTMVRRKDISAVFLCLLLTSAEGSADHAEDNKGRKYRRRLRKRAARRHDDEREQERRLSPALPTTFEHNPTYDSAFDHIRLDLNWPAPDSHREDISSTFGPRLLSASDCISLTNQQQQEAGMPCFDFHPGIDVEGIEGDRVVAVYNGIENIKLHLWWTGRRDPARFCPSRHLSRPPRSHPDVVQSI